MRVAVQPRWGAVGGPTGVGNSRVRIERFLQVHTGLADKFLELGNLADFFEGEDLILLVAVNGEPSRVITAVFEPRKT